MTHRLSLRNVRRLSKPVAGAVIFVVSLIVVWLAVSIPASVWAEGEGAAAAMISPDITDPQSDGAEDLARLYQFVFWAGVIVYVLVQAAIIYTAWRWRQSANSEPRQIHGNTQIEVIWTIVPAIMVVGIALASWQSMRYQYGIPQGDDVLTVNVIGHQWWWEYQYQVSPSITVTTATELVVPVGRKVKLLLDSEDVIHAFWVPQLSGKRDAVPGKRDGGYGQNTEWFVARKPGVYKGSCAELCGAQHGGMLIEVHAVEEGEFDAWVERMTTPLAKPAAGSKEERGFKLVTEGACRGCHAIDGVDGMTMRLGPNLTHLMSRKQLAGGVFENTTDNLTRWIDHPEDLKPATKMVDAGLSPDEINDVVAFLQSLK